MAELGLVVGLLVGLVGGAAILSRVPWDWLLGGGGILVVAGMLLALPTGLWYHVRLRSTLLRSGSLPRTWWLYPTRLHDRIPDERRSWVLRPFYAGAFGMVVSIVGCVFVAYGAWRSPRVSPRVLDVRALGDPHASTADLAVATAAIDEACARLRAGGLVALPTETVYGLGAHALDQAALARIFAAKGRPASHPLIAHVLDLDGARAVSDDVERARVLTDALWPGPLTVVLPRAPRAPGALSGGLGTVAVRAPAHPVARALIAALGAPIAAPSANRYQHVSPTTAAHVVRSLGDAVDLVLDGGPTHSGIESTVVDLVGAPRVLRPGPLGLATLRALLPTLAVGPFTIASDEARSSPGMDARHYAPGAPTALFTTAPPWRAGDGALLCGDVHTEAARAAGVHALVLPRDPESYARGLYAALHELDAAGLSRIFVEDVPSDERWEAVRDRVTRAAHDELGTVGGAQKS